jgi:hypothetical protein
MKRFRGPFLGLIGLFGIVNSPAYASGIPLVLNTTVNSSTATLTINGQNFGSSPVVTLNNSSFPIIQPPGASQIVAGFPNDKPLSTFTPGTYLLTLTFKNQLPSIFTVMIGASGAQGPPGSIGPQGVAGSQGPKGDPGPIGPKGADGATGPAGQNGVAGVQGPRGDTGPQGPQGTQGPQGIQGPKADPGAGGGGLICTTAPNIYLVTASNGTQTCQPRYVDNGDYTVTDNQTGLMWEKKYDPSVPLICHIGDPSCPPDPVHDMHNVYSWSASGTVPDGKLFTGFLAALNLDQSANGSTTCFANHCDWRVPNVVELQTILTCGSGPPCIDPAFGPTQADLYWSSSSSGSDTNNAWYGMFSNGGVDRLRKFFEGYARAVRGSR